MVQRKRIHLEQWSKEQEKRIIIYLSHLEVSPTASEFAKDFVFWHGKWWWWWFSGWTMWTVVVVIGVMVVVNRGKLIFYKILPISLRYWNKRFRFPGCVSNKFLRRSTMYTFESPCLPLWVVIVFLSGPPSASLRQDGDDWHVGLWFINGSVFKALLKINKTRTVRRCWLKAGSEKGSPRILLVKRESDNISSERATDWAWDYSVALTSLFVNWNRGCECKEMWLSLLIPHRTGIKGPC